MEPLPIVTERLVIRRFVESDAEPFQAYRAVPHVARFQGWAPEFTIEQAREFVASVIDAPLVVPGEWIQVAIEESAAGTMVGDLGLGFRDDPGVVELGVTLAPSVHGRGYATEAAGALLEILPELGVRTVEGITDERNHAARRVMERIGLPEVGRDEVVFKGEPCVEITHRLDLGATPTA